MSTMFYITLFLLSLFFLNMSLKYDNYHKKYKKYEKKREVKKHHHSKNSFYVSTDVKNIIKDQLIFELIEKYHIQNNKNFQIWKIEKHTDKSVRLKPKDGEPITVLSNIDQDIELIVAGNIVLLKN